MVSNSGQPNFSPDPHLFLDDDERPQYPVHLSCPPEAQGYILFLFYDISDRCRRCIGKGGRFRENGDSVGPPKAERGPTVPEEVQTPMGVSSGEITIPILKLRGESPA